MYLIILVCLESFAIHWYPPVVCKGIEWSVWDLYDRVCTLAFFQNNMMTAQWDIANFGQTWMNRYLATGWANMWVAIGAGGRELKYVSWRFKEKIVVVFLLLRKSILWKKNDLFVDCLVRLNMEILVPVKVELFIEKKYFRQAEDTELKVENHY